MQEATQDCVLQRFYPRKEVHVKIFLDVRLVFLTECLTVFVLLLCMCVRK